MATADNVSKLELPNENEDFRRLTHMQRALMRIRHDYLTLISLGVIFLFILMAVCAPIISQILGVNHTDIDLNYTYAPPHFLLSEPDPDAETQARYADYTWQQVQNHTEATGHVHWLGTDDKGRDHLMRLIYGAQVSLAVAFAAAGLSIVIGVALGIMTGFYGGVVDDLMIWFITTLNSIPSLFLLLMISALFSPGPLVFIMILGLIGWTGTMRLVRGETLALREREYIVAARAMGASDARIMFQHIMPNLISIVIVALAIDIGVLILVESGLSFLGFGIDPAIPTWGNMLTDGQSFFRRAPHLVYGSGILISITVLCLYIIGDGLRDALDPTVSD